MWSHHWFISCPFISFFLIWWSLPGCSDRSEVWRTSCSQRLVLGCRYAGGRHKAHPSFHQEKRGSRTSTLISHQRIHTGVLPPRWTLEFPLLTYCLAIPGALQRGEDPLAALGLRQPPDKNADGAIQCNEKPSAAGGFAQNGQFLTRTVPYVCMCKEIYCYWLFSIHFQNKKS